LLGATPWSSIYKLNHDEKRGAVSIAPLFFTYRYICMGLHRSLEKDIIYVDSWKFILCNQYVTHEGLDIALRTEKLSRCRLTDDEVTLTI
jgi:hypothetical protein